MEIHRQIGIDPFLDPGQRKRQPIMDEWNPVSGQNAEASVGALLRAHRVARGERLEMVADALRIRVHYLQAIEEDRPERLPSAVYAVGYVKSYAKYLGLDAARIGEEFRHAYLRSRSPMQDPGMGPVAERAAEPRGFFQRWFG